MIGRCLVLVLAFGSGSILYGQASPTASREADAQVGIGFSIARPGYVQEPFRGVSAYADLDFSRHLGVEAEFHQANTSTSDHIYERTYEIGGRYFRTFGPIVPYAKIMIGRGVFNYQYNLDNLGYNMYAGGVGADFKIGQYLHVRGEYEHQRWTSFPEDGLAPQLATVGVAYHFAGKPRYK